MSGRGQKWQADRDNSGGDAQGGSGSSGKAKGGKSGGGGKKGKKDGTQLKLFGAGVKQLAPEPLLVNENILFEAAGYR